MQQFVESLTLSPLFSNYLEAKERRVHSLREEGGQRKVRIIQEDRGQVVSSKQASDLKVFVAKLRIVRIWILFVFD